MADMLKFRKGTYAQINAADKVAGTIYIAKDEKAMYVDVDASTRIRIGDFIRVDTVQGIKPPYSTSALYYVENDNALLKYVETEHEGVKTGTWKQVNGTDDIKASITSLQGNMSQANSDIGTLKTDVGTLKTNVSTLKTTVGSSTSGLVKDVADLKTAIGMDQSGSAGGIGNTVSQLVKDLDALEGTVETQGNTIQEHTGKISALETESAKHATKTELNNAKTAILGQTDGGADFNGTVKGAYDKAATAQTQANKGVADAATAQTKADANEQAISGLTNRVTALDQASTGRVAILEGRVNALETAGYATVDQVTEAKNAVLGTEADDAGTATVHGALKSAAAAKAAADAAAEAAAAAQGDINTWKTDHANDYTNDQINTAVADAKKAGTDAQTALNTYENKHKNDYTNAQIDAKVKAVQDKVDEHTGTLAKLTGDANVEGSVAEAKKAGDDALALIGNANSGLTKTVNSHTTALNILNGADTVNGSVANAKKVGTEAAAQAETNRQNIASLTATVNKLDGDVNTDGSVKKQIKDATTTLKTELSAEIDADIRSANAMTFKKIIDSQSDFDKITEAQVGDTYVIGTAFGNYQAGDFLIAGGEENEVTGNIITIKWNHVKSGYDASLDQKLTGVDNKIKLSTGTGNAGTEVAFAATGSASVAVADDTVTIGMVWEDFK